MPSMWWSVFSVSGVGQVHFLVKHPIHLAAAGCACRSFGMPSERIWYLSAYMPAICLSYFWEACHKNRSRIYTTPKISDTRNIYSSIQSKFLPEMAVDLSSDLNSILADQQCMYRAFESLVLYDTSQPRYLRQISSLDRFWICFITIYSIIFIHIYVIFGFMTHHNLVTQGRYLV